MKVVPANRNNHMQQRSNAMKCTRKYQIKQLQKKYSRKGFYNMLNRWDDALTAHITIFVWLLFPFFCTFCLFTLVSGVSMHIISCCRENGTQLYFAYYYLCIACSEELTVFVSWNQCDYENIWLETGTKVDVHIYVVK